MKKSKLSNLVINSLKTSLKSSKISGNVTIDTESNVSLATMLSLHEIDAPLLVIVPTASKAEKLVDSLHSLALLLDNDLPIVYCPEAIEFTRDFNVMSENSSQRSRAMQFLATGTKSIIVASAGAVISKARAPQDFLKSSLQLSIGDSGIEPQDLAKQLLSMDYDNEFEVHIPGEYALRGGLIDVFSPVYNNPIRIDFFGDEIDDIRFFSVKDQRSFEALKSVIIPPRSDVNAALEADLFDYIKCGNGDVALVFPDRIHDHINEFYPDRLERIKKETSRAVYNIHSKESDLDKLPQIPFFPLEGVLQPLKTDAFFSDIHQQFLLDLLRSWQGRHKVIGCFKSKGVIEFFEKMALEFPELEYEIISGSLRNGFMAPDAGIVVLTENEVFVNETKKRENLNNQVREFESDWTIRDDVDLEAGDIVVHVNYGIAEYCGIVEIDRDDPVETLELLFADDIKIHVPMNQAHLVGKYIGQGKGKAKLSKVGGKSWSKKKDVVEESVTEFAAELIRLHAARETVKGCACDVDDEMQEMFEATFEYEPTEDQHKAFAAVKADMEKSMPMDRLLCGDVGYGKTEVAIRAAFKAVMNGQQVAVVAPTTILAQQHFDSFSERMQNFPVMLDLLCRFRTTKQQKQTVKNLATGAADIVVGTHRLLSKDVKFSNLGLVIIDEEQKFGVRHKEFLKRIRVSVDVLTMSATPIPRTLYMSLTGARDLTTINTPPHQRQAIKTVVSRFDDDLIREAVMRELERGGQIFILHNRVKSIHGFAAKIAQLVPQAKIIIGHGQMETKELEDVMHQFQKHTVDILISTTIIENGVDVPNANTIIIDRADRFGLAELYQIRGRVGRSHRQAYAYLLTPSHAILTSDARERLAAIKKYTQLGAGFKLALRDLEIRGAGNILGANQSGYISTVGFEIYCEMLKDAVNRMKNLPAEKSILTKQCVIKLDFIRYRRYNSKKDKEENIMSASIPKSYINAENLRLEIYRRLAKLKNQQELNAFYEEVNDRFGRPPIPVRNLFQLTTINVIAYEKKIHSIVQRQGDRLFIETERGNLKIAGAIPRIQSDKAPKMLEQVLELLNY